MGLSLYEQETIINMNREDGEMDIYTADPALMRRLSSLPAYTKTREDRQEGKVIAMTFKADKRLLTLRGARKVVALTDEQREELRERGKAIRAKQLAGKSVTLSSNG